MKVSNCTLTLYRCFSEVHINHRCILQQLQAIYPQPLSSALQLSWMPVTLLTAMPSQAQLSNIFDHVLRSFTIYEIYSSRQESEPQFLCHINMPSTTTFMWSISLICPMGSVLQSQSWNISKLWKSCGANQVNTKPLFKCYRFLSEWIKWQHFNISLSKWVWWLGLLHHIWHKWRLKMRMWLQEIMNFVTTGMMMRSQWLVIHLMQCQMSSSCWEVVCHMHLCYLPLS